MTAAVTAQGKLLSKMCSQPICVFIKQKYKYKWARQAIIHARQDRDREKTEKSHGMREENAHWSPTRYYQCLDVKKTRA